VATGWFSAVLMVAGTAAAQRPLGIDISHWQGTITPANWTSVYNSGRVFAFIKASEGTNFTDSRFVSNINNAAAAGLFAGPYHFARPEYGNSATAEANWFMSVAGGYMTAGYLPPVLDLETGSGLGKTALSDWVNEFCNRILTVKSVAPIIYCNTNYAANYLNSSVTVWPLWIANWNYTNPQTQNPPTGVWPTWDFWQYSSTGSVPGISGNCDLDVFNGTFADLQNFLIGGAELPEIALSPAWLSATIRLGRTPASQIFTVSNVGGGTLNYTVSDDADWLNVSPESGSSDGESDAITVSYSVEGLSIGSHAATITVGATIAANSPQTLPVTLTIVPVPGDLDADGDIDTTDVGLFTACMSGPGSPQNEPACADVRYDADLDVDQSDYGVLQKCLSGATIPADPDCPES